MTFSKEWDKQYSNQSHMSIWPWSDLVSFVMRYSRPTSKPYRVLEIGCGAGANIPFFKWLNVDYFAIEGSDSIVKKLHQQYPELKTQICVGDFTKQINFDGEFDLIIDRASLTHNTTEAIKLALGLIFQRLKKGSCYIGIDWFSTEHSQYQNGKADEDIFTKRDFKDGPFKDLGRVHFSDEKHLRDLLNCFEIKILEKTTKLGVFPENNQSLVTWNFVAEKVSE